MGIVQDIIDAEFGCQTHWRDNPLVHQIGVNPTLLFRSHSDRLQVGFINLGVTDAYLYPGEAVATDNGLFLGNSGGFVVMSVKSEGMLPTLQWYGIATVATDIFAWQLLGIAG